MRKRITLLIAALMMALSMSFSGVAFAKNTPAHKGEGQTQKPGTSAKPPPGSTPPGINR
jgi:hypothetical protein